MTTPANPAVAAAPQTSSIQTKAPFVAFNPSNVPPSQSVYLQLNDAIFIRTMANAVFSSAVARYRYLTPQGEIKEGILPLGIIASVQLFTLPLGEAWLLSILIDPVSGAGAGTWIYAQVGVARGLFASGTITFQGILWEGYTHSGELNGWPGFTSKQILDGSGILRSITGSVPAAGADINEVVPFFRRWQLLYMHANLTTSAAVANRQPGLLLDDGGNTLFLQHTTLLQAAGVLVQYQFANGIPGNNDSVNTVGIPIPPLIALKGSFRLRTNTAALQAGDQWTAPQYLIYEWGEWDE